MAGVIPPIVRSRDKLQAVNRISSLTGSGPEELGPGAKERKRVLERLVEGLHLDLDVTLNKVDLAEAIVETLGGSWGPGCYSTGHTITLTGLDRVLEAATAEVARRSGHSDARRPGLLQADGELAEHQTLTGSSAMDDDPQDVADDNRSSLEEVIRCGLAELSKAEITPEEVDVAAEFDPRDVSFEDESWMQYLLKVQDWMRLPERLDWNESAAEMVGGLFDRLGGGSADDAFVLEDGAVRLTTVGLDLLRDRVERSVRLKDQFVEHLESTGSVLAATNEWIELWNEAVEEDVPGGPVIARADVWPINDFASKAQKGRLNLSPSYQRGDVWPTKDAQTLIESILRGIPLPSVILLKPKGDGAPYEVVDGKQRLTAILRFIGGHPSALAEVERREREFPGHDLVQLFKTDYPKFKRVWKNVTGEQLSAGAEREHYFPFQLSASSPALSGDLEAFRGKYFHSIRDSVVSVGGGRFEIGDIFQAVTDYKIPVIEYTEATPRQIHEVFHLYNKQGKHLNAEEIRNALYHEVDLMRALSVAAGDGPPLEDPDALGDGDAARLAFLWPVREEVRAIASLLNDYKFGDARYRRTKVLSWLFSVVFVDSMDGGRPRLLSTAQQINELLVRASTKPDAFQSGQTIRSSLLLAHRALHAHSSVAEAWAPTFKDNGRGVKWQELQLIASLVGMTMAAAVLGDGTMDRLEECLPAVRALSDDSTRKDAGWSRPSKTQTSEQWSYIARVALDLVDALHVDHRAVAQVLTRDFGGSCVAALERVRPRPES